MTVTKIDFIGMFFPNELWGKDKLEFYRNIAIRGSTVNIDRYDAQKKLEFYAKFDPGIPHDRIVAQKVSAYLIKNPELKNIKKNLVLINRSFQEGDLEKTIEVDFADEFKRINNNITLPYTISSEIITLGKDMRCEKTGNLYIDFRLKGCAYETPMLIQIKDYISIDGEIIKQEDSLHFPIFDRSNQLHSESKSPKFERYQQKAGRISL